MRQCAVEAFGHTSLLRCVSNGAMMNNAVVVKVIEEVAGHIFTEVVGAESLEWESSVALGSRLEEFEGCKYFRFVAEWVNGSPLGVVVMEGNEVA